MVPIEAFKKTPHYVTWALFVQMRGYASGTQIKKLILIYKAFPQFFPWESKYYSLPKEIHDNFEKECYPERFNARYEFDQYLNSKEFIDDVPEIKRDGILKQMEKSQKIKPIVITIDDITKALFDFYEITEIRKNQAIKRAKEIRSIWKKHYNKYGLECREPECLAVGY